MNKTELHNAIHKWLNEDAEGIFFYPFLKDTKNLWNIPEILSDTFNQYKLTEVIIRPELNPFGRIKYHYYVRLQCIMEKIGYKSAAHLFKEGRVLYHHKKYYLNDLSQLSDDVVDKWDKYDKNSVEYQLMLYQIPLKTYIPATIVEKKDRNKNRYIYIDTDACMHLLLSASKKKAITTEATALMDVFKLVNRLYENITVPYINIINKLTVKEIDSKPLKKAKKIIIPDDVSLISKQDEVLALLSQIN